MGEYLHDSRSGRPTNTPEPPTTEPLEIEGSGLGASQQQRQHSSSTPENYRRLYNKMADPIDSALCVPLNLLR